MAISTSSAASVHIHEDDLLLFAEGTLEETLSAAIADHVELCPECRQQLSSIARFRREYYQATTAIDERRREHRIQTNDPAMLRMLNPLVGKLMVIRVVDVSKNGAKLHTPIAIPVGGLVQVRVRQSIILGEVRYCVTVRGQFYSGIRIQGLHQFSSPPRLPNPDDCLNDDALAGYVRGEVRNDGAAVNDHLMRCCSCRDNLGKLIGDKFIAEEAHWEAPRLRLNDSVLLRTLDPFGAQLWEAGIVEISPAEITLRAPLAVHPGAIIQLVAPHNLVILGQVRDCVHLRAGAASLRLRVLSTFSRS